jgi:hypothetical protein
MCGAEDRKRLTLGSAIEWMMRHELRKLTDLDGHHWHYDGVQDFVLTTPEESCVANILLPNMLQHTFVIHQPAP